MRGLTNVFFREQVRLARIKGQSNLGAWLHTRPSAMAAKMREPSFTTTILSPSHRFDLIVGQIDHRRAQRLMQLADFHAQIHPKYGVEV